MTSNSVCTAWRISILLASFATMNVYVRSSSCSIADASVTAGRTMTSRGSRMCHLLRALECGRLDDQRISPQHVVRGLVTERPHLHPRNVACGPVHDRLVTVRQQQHVQPRVLRRAERGQQCGHPLRLRCVELKSVEDEYAAILRAHVVRGPTREPADLLRYVLPEIPVGARTEHVAAAAPLRGADRALARAAGALLAPRLAVAALHHRARLR